MIKPFTCLTVLLAASSGLYLYSEKHKTTLLDGRIRAVVADTGRTLDRTAMLRAEWALLNQPDRLQALAARFLPQLQPMAPTQFVQVGELAKHLPAEGPPPDAVPVSPGSGIMVAAGAGAGLSAAPVPVVAGGAAATAVAAAAAAKPAWTAAKATMVKATAVRMRHAPVVHRTMLAALAPRLPGSILPASILPGSILPGSILPASMAPSLVHQVASFSRPPPMLAASWRQAPAAPVFAGSALGMAHTAMAPPMAAR